MNRRQLLGGVLAGTTATLSGCGVLESSGPEVVLDHVTVRNLDDSDHVVDVEVLRDGELFRQKTVSVVPKTSDDSSGSHVGGIVIDGSEQILAEYVVRAKFEQDEEWEETRPEPLDLCAEPSTSEDPDTPCVAVEVQITDAGEIALWLGDLCDC